jgi:hypothetical protein
MELLGVGCFYTVTLLDPVSYIGKKTVGYAERLKSIHAAAIAKFEAVIANVTAVSANVTATIADFAACIPSLC